MHKAIIIQPAHSCIILSMVAYCVANACLKVKFIEMPKAKSWWLIVESNKIYLLKEGNADKLGPVIDARAHGKDKVKVV